MKKRLAKKLSKREKKAEKAVLPKVAPAETVIAEKVAPAENVIAEKAAQIEAVKPETAQIEAVKPETATAEPAAAKNTAAPKAAAKVNIFYQSCSHQVEQQDIIAMIKSQWKDQGNKVKDLKELVVYLKPEEKKAYYVINDTVKGFVAIC